MQKHFIMLAGAGIFALAACSHTATRSPVAASAIGCSQLGDTAPTSRTLLSPSAVYATRRIEEPMFIGRASVPMQRTGTEVHVVASPGLTGQYVARTLSCHATRGAAFGPNDPLHPSTGSVSDVSVEPAGGGYAVRIMGSSEEANAEIWQRAQQLAPAGSVTVEQLASRVGSGTL